MIWKEYFEDLYNDDKDVCDFNGARRGTNFGGEAVSGTEIEVKLKNTKAAGKVRGYRVVGVG